MSLLYKNENASSAELFSTILNCTLRASVGVNPVLRVLILPPMVIFPSAKTITSEPLAEKIASYLHSYPPLAGGERGEYQFSWFPGTNVDLFTDLGLDSGGPVTGYGKNGLIITDNCFKLEEFYLS
jgi:hypothetical protein